MNITEYLHFILTRIGALEYAIAEVAELTEANKTTLNVDEAARFLKLSKDRIYTLINKRKIPHYRNEGKRVYFDRSELEAWLKSRRVATDEELLTAAATHATAHPTPLTR